MNPCDDCAIKTLRYLGNDLDGQELTYFLLHLESCASCREHLEAEKKLSETLHRSRPLYSAPAALRDRLAAATMQSASSRTQVSAFSRVSRFPGERFSAALRSLASWRVLIPATAAIALCLAVLPNIERRVQAASYVETAVATHRSYVNGDLRLGLKADSPEQVTSWFAGRVPFDFRPLLRKLLPTGSPALAWCVTREILLRW